MDTIATSSPRPQRRAFLRLVGGGVVLAAAPLAGCSSAMPAEAIAPWQGPPDSEADPRRWALAHALLAPHSHNLQSWQADLREADTIVLRCDPTRTLPVTDPFSRQIMMSHGTFLEVLEIALRERGQRAEITLFPDGPFESAHIDGRPVARVRVRPDAAVPRDPLFAQIRARRTHRGDYDLQRPIDPVAWQAMAQAAASPGLRLGFTEAPAELVRHRAIANEAWRIELTTPAAMLESLRVLRVGAAEVRQHRDGLTLLDPKVEWLVRLGLFDRGRAPGADDLATRQQIEAFAGHLAATPAFLWLVSEGNSRATQVAAGRAYVRLQLAATAFGIGMQPLQQALQEYAEEAGPYRAVRALLQAPEPTHTVQMWARVGHAAPIGPAPRRPLEALISA